MAVVKHVSQDRRIEQLEAENLELRERLELAESALLEIIVDPTGKVV